ncbi:hypothetical protein, unlikely [Trypanosoma congolense IL3000]|uniref:Uncharacterized protein n=1 Tax=Trypanosoma congolense (strain IL3000) TaxID=1068625 RepID=F9W9J6_TRYCI|nr:hypothetical protein, unlikely [Trypanosoma congolense IL3000]
MPTKFHQLMWKSTHTHHRYQHSRHSEITPPSQTRGLPVPHFPHAFSRPPTEPRVEERRWRSENSSSALSVGMRRSSENKPIQSGRSNIIKRENTCNPISSSQIWNRNKPRRRQQ